ncbi:hypothetical protein C8R43DRAFT_974903 [Mycena crocata]|nr:hypothetical protein C8R43DRAFT_974903 [Mycena crocata]
MSSSNRNNRVVDPSRSINVSSPVLILQLNQLLTSLDLSIAVGLITTHRQVTPSLLICILESILSIRLPISTADRDALFSSSATTAAAARVLCMKIFLGVLQSDILQQDVGLGNVDPRKLARTADDETIFVARLLCWYGRRMGLISRTRSDPDARGSPSTLTTVTKRTETSLGRAFSSSESNTSVSGGGVDLTEDVDADGAESPFSGGFSSPELDPPGPRCIHEVPSPSLVLSPSSTRPDVPENSGLGFTSTHSQNTTVRYTGYIECVDEDAEIAAFEEEKRRKARRTGKRRQHAHASAPINGPLAEDRALADQCAAAQARRATLLKDTADMQEELARLQLEEHRHKYGS